MIEGGGAKSMIDPGYPCGGRKKPGVLAQSR